MDLFGQLKKKVIYIIEAKKSKSNTLQRTIFLEFLPQHFVKSINLLKRTENQMTAPTMVSIKILRMAVVKLYIRFQEKKMKKTSSHFLKRNKKCVHLVIIEIKMVDGERWEVYDK